MFGFDTVAKSIEGIAKEWIETDSEKAEAKALMVKTLDPNGLMRRDISSKVSTMYVGYVLIMVILTIFQAFGWGHISDMKMAIDNLTSLFVPITAMFTAIVGASFGTNAMNIHKGK